MDDDVKSGIKRCIPTLGLFVVVFVIVFIILTKNTGDSVLTRIPLSFFLGWVFAGMIWGWNFTGRWFHVGIAETFSKRDSMLIIFMLLLLVRYFISVFIGVIVMPIELIRLIITLVRARRANTMIKGDNTEQG